MKAFLQMKLPPQNRRKGPCSINELYIGLQKMKKGTLFYQLALARTRRKRVSFFLSILLSLKKIGKGVKFQDITPIRATTFTNTLANDINNGHPSTVVD